MKKTFSTKTYYADIAGSKLFLSEYLVEKIFRSKISLVCICLLTLSQTSPGFYVSVVQVFWKHCGKRRNCSIRAISPFPTVFSTHFGEHFAVFIKFKIIVCRLFQFGPVQNLFSVNGLILVRDLITFCLIIFFLFRYYLVQCDKIVENDKLHQLKKSDLYSKLVQKKRDNNHSKEKSFTNIASFLPKKSNENFVFWKRIRVIS